MISKYGPLLSKAVGQVDPFFLVVKKSHFNKNIHLTVTVSLQTPQNRKYILVNTVNKTCLKQPLKKRQNRDLNNKW